jgi:hypothetical protein
MNPPTEEEAESPPTEEEYERLYVASFIDKRAAYLRRKPPTLILRFPGNLNVVALSLLAFSYFHPISRLHLFCVHYCRYL